MLRECLSVRVRGPVFSRFDLVAACGTSFLKNLAMTIVLPVVLYSAEARSTDSPLLSSGLVAASFSVGMVLSTCLMCCWPPNLLDSRLPFVVCACLLLIGNAFYLAAELLLWPTIALIACRFGMALGFGAQFAGKRRCSAETNKSRREYAFVLVEAANSAGQAAGPILMGTVGLLASLDWTITDPGDVGRTALDAGHGNTTLHLENIVDMMKGDLFGRSIRAPFAQLYTLMQGGVSMLLAVVPSVITIVLTGVFLIAVLTLRTDVPFFQKIEPPPPVGASAAHGSRPKEATPLITPNQQQRDSDDDPPPPLWVSYVVQCSCLFYGVARNFLFFGFESAAVVVYNRELLMPVSAASLWVGCCALTPLFAMALYSRYRASLEGKTQQLLLASEVMGVGASLLFLASCLFDVETPLADASEPDAAAQRRLDGVRAPFLLLLTFGSVCFYGSIYLGAAMGNSHPLSYAVDGHPLLSRSAMIAEQQILQSTLGKGLGMVVCRVALGDPVRLENLARLFLYVMATQIIVLAFGWDPLATQRRWRALRGRVFAAKR